MLIGLGFLMIAVFMYLILSKRLTPVVALILVPVVFGIAAVQFGAAVLPEDGGVTDSIMDAIKSFAPTAALLFFAIIYFGLMIDVGLFDPLIRLILRVVGNSPVRLVIGTAVLAGLVSLDGDGSTTFIITTWRHVKIASSDPTTSGASASPALPPMPCSERTRPLRSG